MRIDILIYAYEPTLGEMGGVRKLLELGKGFAQAGHAVAVFAPDFIDIHEPALEVVTYPTLSAPILRPASAFLRMSRAVRRHARKTPPDIVYARTSRDILPSLTARWLGARFVFEVNGDAFGEQGWRRGVLRALTILFADWVNCRLANRVVAITPGLARMVERRYGIASEKVCCIPSGTSVDHVRPMDPEACRKKLDLDPGRPVVAFLGVLYEHQGVETLLSAFAEVLREEPDVCLLVVGDGPVRPALEEQALALGLGDAARFTGSVPYAEIPDYLGAATCCVAPFAASRGETSPLKLFDYMAAGRATVATSIPAVEGLMEESQAIVPVPPDDVSRLAQEIIRLLRDPRRRKTLGDNGRTYVERRHGWDQIAERILGECLGCEQGTVSPQ